LALPGWRTSMICVNQREELNQKHLKTLLKKENKYNGIHIFIEL
jgi:hypothetical protein